MNSRLLVILCCILPLLIVSCSKKPRSVLSQEEMIAVLTDLEIATSLSEAYNVLPVEYRNNEEYKQRIILGVYKKHNITKAKLDSSLVWYSENLNEYNTVNDSLISQFRGIASILREDQTYLKTNNYKRDKDRRLQQSYLNVTHPLIRLNFEKSEFEKLDKNLLSIKFGILGMDNRDSLEANFYFKYKDTTVINNFMIFRDSVFHIAKPELADSLLRDLNGYIRIRNKRDSIKPILVYNLSYIDSTLYKVSTPDSLKTAKATDFN